jgi:aryl-phospho-beta-D-glucosidase BglC (GH1 family)
MKFILSLFSVCSIVGSFSLSYAQNQSPYSGLAISLPAKFEAENYDKGGQGVAYNDAESANLGNAFRTTEGVDIENCSEGGYNIGYTSDGEWLEYTVNVSASGNHKIELRTASTQSGSLIRVEIDGNAVTSDIPLPNTSGWQTWTTTAVPAVVLNAGQHVLRLAVVRGGFNINYLTVSSLFLSNGPGFLRAEAKNIVNKKGNYLIKAINLGNYMVQEGYMMNLGGQFQYVIKQKIADAVGVANRDKFYNDYYNNFITKADIENIARMGFNSVRLPMHYNLFTPLGQQDVYIEKGFTLVDNILAWCKANNLYLILDLHATPGGQSNGDISDYVAGQPSLWESQANRDQTIKLWKRFAERYVNEEYIGGYDLINETNWTLPNNGLLVELMKNITTAIRQVDNNHILFIEGNSYANDFTNMTPKWDNNMAYSFHKYWNDNTDASLNFILAIRDGQNVPIWLGEFGENSNTWIADAVTLFNKHNIGWAVWPYKKMASISGLSSFKEPANWSSLATFINGGAQPSQAAVQAILNELVENVKVQNCTVNKGYWRALFDQQANNNTIAYAAITLPGKVQAAQYDEGKQGYAYNDKVYQTTHFGAAGGDYTAWNTGWSGGRNDGVDLEFSTAENTTTVGWTEDNEWLQYTVDVITSGSYAIKARVAGNGGNLTVSVNNNAALNNTTIASTGGWANWQTLTIGNVNLVAGRNILRVTFNKAGFNLNYLDFSVNAVNKLPTVSINSPSNGTTFTAPASFSLNAIASDADGTVAQVEFYNGTALLGTAFTAPYTYSWSNLPIGTYNVTAKAIDNLGGVTVSSVITITVNSQIIPNQPPNVTLTAPLNNATANAPSDILISADAIDSDGIISKVEFYNGSALIGFDNTAPYSYLWMAVGAGTYSITAKAIDNLGATKTAAAATVKLLTIVTDVCSGIPDYLENGGYTVGSKVKSDNNRYECKPWPFSSWCNGAAWAYEPGSGAYWSDAWNVLGSCGSSRSSSDNATDATTSAGLIAYPNPFVTTATLSVEVKESGDVSLKLYDHTGVLVKTITEDYLVAGSYRFSLNMENEKAGMYTIQYRATHDAAVSKLVKAE